ncbi:MAG: glucosaminidase domain-containing protein [Bacteroidota bacterium]|nr:glucosaminidase domain-containing protein [Bacteroidota bacterium]
MTREDYIRKFSNAVLNSVRGTTIFPSVKMAQAIIESSDQGGNAGESKLASFFNNHFGIKANGLWKGKKAFMKTREVDNGQNVIIEDTFRVYTNPESSFHDHTLFLTKNRNYTEAGVFNAMTPEAQADALQRGRYATDPRYAYTIKKIIERHNLKALDQLSKKND